jgi:hypothetical protein
LKNNLAKLESRHARFRDSTDVMANGVFEFGFFTCGRDNAAAEKGVDALTAGCPQNLAGI